MVMGTVTLTNTTASFDGMSGLYRGSRETFDSLSFKDADAYMARVWDGATGDDSWPNRKRALRKAFGNDMARVIIRCMANDGVTGTDNDGHPTYN